MSSLKLLAFRGKFDLENFANFSIFIWISPSASPAGIRPLTCLLHSVYSAAAFYIDVNDRPKENAGSNAPRRKNLLIVLPFSSRGLSSFLLFIHGTLLLFSFYDGRHSSTISIACSYPAAAAFYYYFQTGRRRSIKKGKVKWNGMGWRRLTTRDWNEKRRKGEGISHCSPQTIFLTRWKRRNDVWVCSVGDLLSFYQADLSNIRITEKS